MGLKTPEEYEEIERQERIREDERIAEVRRVNKAWREDHKDETRSQWLRIGLFFAVLISIFAAATIYANSDYRDRTNPYTPPTTAYRAPIVLPDEPRCIDAATHEEIDAFYCSEEFSR